MGRVQTPEIGQLLQDGGGFEFDVAVLQSSWTLGAKMLLRTIKAYNRRGRVRYFLFSTSDRWDVDTQTFKAEYWEQRVDKDYVDRQGYPGISDALTDGFDNDGDHLMVSFEDRSDARAFKRELDASALSPSALAELEAERAERERFTSSYYPADLPRDKRWCVMVAPLLRSANEIDAWFRRHIDFRYTATNYSPGHRSLALNRSRYWRLDERDWHLLITACEAPETYLIVHFVGERDYRRFDRHFGPLQFLRAY